MRINNNMMAMNTHRQLGAANAGGAKSMEKLSSGMRINRAGDDAAGLSISEKMRGQIRGLNQASSNAQDGISLIQTAEGALNETHAILQRMRELAVQSSTDTNTDDDRLEIQKEVDQLSAEITRIAETTQFNTMELLDGSYKDKEFHIGANKGQSTTIAIDNMDAKSLSVGTEGFEGKSDALEGLTFSGILDADDDGAAKEVTITFTAASTDTDNTATDFKVETDEDGAITVTLAQEAGTDAAAGDVTTTEAELKSGLAAAGITVKGNMTGDMKDFNGDATLKAGADPVKASKGIGVSSQSDANTAIETINTAITTVSSERSKLGAMQNRLEHTIKNLDTSSENLQASEARIRDVDMAKEMMEQTKQNILAQASTAMLANANSQPESVLQLLR